MFSYRESEFLNRFRTYFCNMRAGFVVGFTPSVVKNLTAERISSLVQYFSDACIVAKCFVFSARVRFFPDSYNK